MAGSKNRYVQIIESIFLNNYKEGASEVIFNREDIVNTAAKLNIGLKNPGDVLYSFRYRASFPNTIIEKATEGYAWIIRSAGRAQYKFVMVKEPTFSPNHNLAKVKIPDATPEIVARYSFDDEQALLAKIRYNRLIDIFTGVTYYSLQNHLRTTLKTIGQIETDEVYVGVDKQGVHYVFPVQAKGGTDKIGVVQIEQDFIVCEQKFSSAIGRPIAAQFMQDKTIVLFEFTKTDDGIRVLSEKHFALVSSEEISESELNQYRQHRTSEY